MLSSHRWSEAVVLIVKLYSLVEFSVQEAKNGKKVGIWQVEQNQPGSSPGSIALYYISLLIGFGKYI